MLAVKQKNKYPKRMKRCIAIIACWASCLLPLGTLYCQEYLSQVPQHIQEYHSPNHTADSVMAVDIKYVDWDIMPITDISPQDFESWNGYQLHLTDEATIRQLIHQITDLRKDSAPSFDTRGKISIIFAHDTMVYHYSRFHLFDGTQYYTLSPQLQQNLLKLTAQSPQ